MSATLNALAQSGNVPPRMQLTLSGMTPDATVVISRVDASGNRTPVRTANPATIVSGGWVGWDYEAPFWQFVSYRADGSSGSTAFSGNHRISVQKPWLLHPGIPSYSMPVEIAARGDETRSLNQGVFNPIGRTNAVVRTDGARHSPSFDLTLRTYSLDQEDSMTAILGDGSALLLQTVYPGIERATYEWLSLADLTVSNAVQWAGNLVRTWTATATTVDPPSGLLQSLWSVADVASGYSTVADVAAAYATVRDVILNNPS